MSLPVIEAPLFHDIGARTYKHAKVCGLCGALVNDCFQKAHTQSHQGVAAAIMSLASCVEVNYGQSMLPGFEV